MWLQFVHRHYYLTILIESKQTNTQSNMNSSSILQDSQTSSSSILSSSVSKSTFLQSIDLGSERDQNEDLNFSQLLAGADDVSSSLDLEGDDDVVVEGSRNVPASLVVGGGGQNVESNHLVVGDSGNVHMMGHGYAHDPWGISVGQQQQDGGGDAAFTVTASRLGEETFTVNGFIRNDRRNKNDIITVSQAIQVASTPDFLRLWFEPISSLFVTKESTSSPSKIKRGYEENMDSLRQYDAEWLEAVALINHPSQIYNALSSLKSTCFANHGKMKMFIERARGHIAITIGPVGGCEATHTLSFKQTPSGVHVADMVRIDRSSVFCCYLPQKVKEILLPSIASHMSQTIRSIDNLIRISQRGPEEFMDVSTQYTDEASSLDNDSGGTPLLESRMYL